MGLLILAGGAWVISFSALTVVFTVLTVVRWSSAQETGWGPTPFAVLALLTLSCALLGAWWTRDLVNSMGGGQH